MGHVDSEMDSLTLVTDDKHCQLSSNKQVKRKHSDNVTKKYNDVYCHVRYIITSICTSAGGKLGTLLTFTVVFTLIYGNY